MDVGTDLLPALALGAEAPSPEAMRRPPTDEHLLDRRVLTGVVGVLGPVEATAELLAFTAVLVATQNRPATSAGSVRLQRAIKIEPAVAWS